MLIQITLGHSKFDIELEKDGVFIVEKLTQDDASPPESPLFAARHFI